MYNTCPTHTRRLQVSRTTYPGQKTGFSNIKGQLLALLLMKFSQMVKSVTKHSNHIVRQAAPLFDSHLHIIVSFCDFNLQVPLAVKPCILLGHTLFLRASNLVSPTMDVWGGPHTLRVNDVTYSQNKLMVRIHSTITQVKPVVITVLPNPSKAICPVRAWYNYISVISPNTCGPAFLISPARSLTAKMVVTCMSER